MGTRQRRNLGLRHRCLRCCGSCVTLNNAGKRDEELKVIAKGGELKVTYCKDDSVILKGPATLVFDGVIDIPDEIVSK